MKRLFIFPLACILIISNVHSQNFIRGDVSADGIVNNADEQMLQAYLFMGGPLTCYLAGDVDDLGGTAPDMSDYVYLVSFLSGGPQPPAPFPGCGVDPTNPQPGTDCCTLTGCCIGIRGNIDGDPTDEINIADLVYFVSYSFDSPPGPEPPCLEEADVNGIEGLNIGDIVFMVSYMFDSPPGPAPVDCP